MGSKASTPVVVKEVLTQACNMRDVQASFVHQASIPMLLSVLLVVVVLVFCSVVLCLMRRHYHRKIHKYSSRRARVAEDVSLVPRVERIAESV